MDSSRLCRLCLKTSNDLVNIFDSFQGSTIASVLAQHFWFQINKNDGFPECLCEICWIQTKTFHNFYKRVQWVHRDYSVNLYGAESVPCTDLIKQERSDSPSLEPSPCNAILETDLSIVKYEKTESPAEMNGLLISKQETCDFNEDYGMEQSNMQISYQEQYVSKERKKNKVGDTEVTENVVPPPDIECTSSSEEYDLDDNPQSFNVHTTNECSKDEENSQIREFFNMECDICRDPILQFETLQQVRKHYSKTHNIGGYITCCGKRFHRRYRVLDHIKFHLNPNAFRCEPCNKQFKDGIALKNHMVNHETFYSPDYKCKECGKTFMKPSTLAQHERLQHRPEKEKTELQCDKCEKKFTSALSLKSHIRGVHESTYSQICDICAQVFKHKSTFRNHMKLLHSSTVPQKVQCNVCGAWLKHEVGLKKHLKRHREDYASCPICKKVVQNKASLYSHIQRVHRNGRPHQCTMCDKAFKTRTTLKEHIAIHTGEDLYHCEYCDKKFKSGANMYSHRKAAHFAEWSRDFPKRISLEKTSTKISTDADRDLLEPMNK